LETISQVSHSAKAGITLALLNIANKCPIDASLFGQLLLGHLQLLSPKSDNIAKTFV